MTKHTTRDQIWNAVLELKAEKADESSYNRKFEASEVAARIDADPSDRTVRDTLKTMVEMGHLDEPWRQGRYQVPEQAEPERSSQKI
jgi:hypothetical protein